MNHGNCNDYNTAPFASVHTRHCFKRYVSPRTAGTPAIRLLSLENHSILKTATLALVFFMMVANALWNYVFFRARDLYAGFVSGSLAPILDLALFICLLLLDKTAAWVLVPYLIYQLYAVSLGYELWKMNRSLS